MATIYDNTLNPVIHKKQVISNKTMVYNYGKKNCLGKLLSE